MITNPIATEHYRIHQKHLGRHILWSLWEHECLVFVNLVCNAVSNDQNSQIFVRIDFYSDEDLITNTKILKSYNEKENFRPNFFFLCAKIFLFVRKTFNHANKILIVRIVLEYLLRIFTKTRKIFVISPKCL